MGRIKSLMIKKAARELQESIPEFSVDFEHNKKLLKGSIYYKSVRNRVAGEITGLIKKSKKKAKKKKEVIQEESTDY